MARNKGTASSKSTKSQRRGRTQQVKALRRRRRSPARARTPAAREAIEEVRRAPLQPEIPVNPDAPVAALDPDALEVLNQTQALAEDQPGSGVVGEDSVDRKRGTVLTGGDVDAAWDEVDVGEETVGGSTPTPDQDVVDDLGRAAGVTYSASEPLRPEEKIVERDEKRWEVDPASSEDYQERERALRRRRRKR
jgi:hypothetical protein